MASCTTCEGCGSEGESVSDSGEGCGTLSHLEYKIRQLQKTWSVPLDEEEEQRFDEQLNDIGLRLANYNMQALKPLMLLYEELGPKVFFPVALRLVELQLLGHLICWSFLYSNSDPKTFADNILKTDLNMLKYTNKEANIYECFAGNPKVGRALIPQGQDRKEMVDNNNSKLQSRRWNSLCIGMVLIAVALPLILTLSTL